MTTTVHVGVDDWTLTGAAPRVGAWFSFKPFNLSETGARFLSAKAWTLRIVDTGSDTTVVPDAVSGEALVIDSSVDGWQKVYVAGYPTGDINLTDLVSKYVVDPSTLVPLPSGSTALQMIQAVQVTADAAVPSTSLDAETAALVGNSGTALETQLSANFVSAGPDSINAATKAIPAFTSRQAPDSFSGGLTKAFLAKPHGDGMPGVVDWLHHDTIGYLFHLQSGTIAPTGDSPGAAPAFMIACGLDVDDGAGGPGVGGILIANKKYAQGIQLHQMTAIDNGQAWGFYGYQESIATLVRLESAQDGVAPLLELAVMGTAAPTTTTQVLANFKTYGNHLSGSISAYDGTLLWIDPANFRDTTVNTTLTLKNSTGSGPQARMVLTSNQANPGIIEAGVNAAQQSNPEFVLFRPTGASTNWAYRFTSTGATAAIQTAPAAAKGSEVFSTMIEVGSGKLGFFGVPSVVRPAAYTQTYTTAAKSVPAPTAAAVATTASTTGAYGFTQTQADALVSAVNALVADSLANKKTINAIIDDLQALGLAQ